ncbi:hypothetical protein HMPREF9946_00714 [Acetobacteraceae bacterium AT-5844]|nr:hypothetical protein HMPREF9946_00714 [Acetobacteraceae bacterium AT-5844]
MPEILVDQTLHGGGCVLMRAWALSSSSYGASEEGSSTHQSTIQAGPGCSLRPATPRSPGCPAPGPRP